MKTKEEIEKIVKDFMSGHEEGTFVRNKNGVLMYYTEDKQTGLNLEVFFEDLLEYALEYHASQFQQEWIPVEQSLPKEFGIYDVTAVYKGETFVTTVCYDLTIWLTYADVIAWKQQSQPYNPTQS